ncbi:hypothetical protein AB0L53_46460 [Nonomuraea sp. NPDC052129]|uniref:hypothetical protein n=1 Tax=Nonomuraea sp. NPDC052129 TaxID=3154651 RepID=UPI00343A1E02
MPGLLAELCEGPPLAATVGWDAFGWTADDRVTGRSEVLMMVGTATIPGPAGVAGGCGIHSEPHAGVSP